MRARIVAQHLRAGVERAAAALSGDHRDADATSAGYRDAIARSTTAPPPPSPRISMRGRAVAVICEGDPLFYGSYMHLHVRLASRYPAEVVAGVTGMSGCWSAAGAPIAQGDDVFTVLPATLPEDELDAPACRRRCRRGDEGRPPSAEGAPRARPRRAACRAPSMSSAAPWRSASRCRSPTSPTTTAPYFAMVLVPGWEGRPGATMSGLARRRRPRAGRARAI